MNSSFCVDKHSPYNDSWCPPIFDTHMCWPPAPPGQNVSLVCPQIKGVISGAMAYRTCQENGSWEVKNNTEFGYTHYEHCFPPAFIKLLDMCLNIKGCLQIVRITRYIELVGLSLSLVSLLISLGIFFQYRVLKNNRTMIHKNLFLATLLHILVRLIKYVEQELTPANRTIECTPVLNEICSALLEYTKTAMFMWMFIEGLYLHNMITVTVFQEHTHIKLYFYIGWTAPAIMTAVWVATMLAVKSEWDFYYFLPYYWILEGPRSAIVVINLIFLVNIIRVLIVKLRESHSTEIQQVRKAVRAAIFLLPLMGIANVAFWIDYQQLTEGWKLALWMYPSYFLATFQGFFVAVLYCFLNGEVQAALKHSIYSHMTLKHDYTPCRNLTIISTAAEAETPNASEGRKWIRYCLKHIKKNHEDRDIKEVNNLPRLSNEDTDSTIVGDKSFETKA